MNARTKAPLDRAAVQRMIARLGRKIAGARVERSMSQADVAELAETTPARVSEIENAAKLARIDTIARIAQAVGLEITVRNDAA